MTNKVDLNTEQQAAVDLAHDSPAIVSAAAGSGKTTLLVERIIRLISDRYLDIPADSLAVMTFTKNATKNMREKLNRALNERIKSLAGEKNDEERELHDYLKKQLFALRRASISTIDAFCLRMIKENAEAFDMPVNFTVADGAKKAAMQSQAMKAAMEELYNGSSFTDEERDALFFSFSFEDDGALEKAVLSAADKLSSFTNQKGWLNCASSVYSDIPSIEKNFLPLWDNRLDAYVNDAVRLCKSYSAEKLYDELMSAVKDETAAKKSDKFRDEVMPLIKEYIKLDETRINALQNDHAAYKASKTFANLNLMIENLEHNSEKMSKINSNSGRQYDGKQRFNFISKSIDGCVDRILELKPDLKSETDIFPTTQKAVNSFLRLLEIYIDIYQLEKSTEGCVDFSDCELLLYEKLNENNGENLFRQQISERFKCLIVDEFQDSNEIQAKIFELIGGSNRFYVGDVKQSIYAFRGADPYIMAELCGKDNKTFTKTLLNTNYRSGKAVIDTVNLAFTGLMTANYGGVDYDESSRLNPRPDLPQYDETVKELYRSELCFVTAPKAAQDDADDKDMTLPRYVANKIKKLHDDPNFLIGKDKEHEGQPAKYSDFIILLRTNSKTECYRKALKELGIGSAVPKGSGFFNAEEIVLICNYLKIIDNPMLNEEMLKVLMSPIYRFTAEETAQLKMGILGIQNAGDEQLKAISNAYRKRKLFTCVKDCMSQKAVIGDEKGDVTRTISPKLKRFFNDLSGFRNFMNSNSLDNLIRKIYEDTDFISIVSAFEDSESRVENIRLMQRLAGDFEARGGGNLGDFLRFLERAKENNSKSIEQAARAESSSDAVRIMTFHGCKGLEAPVCIMSELQSQMNKSDLSSNLILNRDHFLAMKHTDRKRRFKMKPAAYRALSEFIRERQLGDELRLLYVAMTRAREKLIMVSATGEKSLTEFEDFIKKNRVSPELFNSVYENYVPFKCVFANLLNGISELEKPKKPRKSKKDVETPAVDDEKITKREIAFNNIECKLSVEKYSPTDSISVPVNNIKKRAPSQQEIDEISQLLKQEYKPRNFGDTQQKAKFTVTELAHKKEPKPIGLTKPSFIKTQNSAAVSGVEKGNAYHHCMEHFPLDEVKADMNEDDILNAVNKAVEAMVKERRITEEESSIIENFRVAKFFVSPLGKRVLNAYAQNHDNVRREQPFYAEVNGREVRRDYDGILSIQGQIDMYFIEDGEIVVVDYKSDTLENLAKEQKNYEFQVEIYKNILGKLTGIKVKEMYLYAFLADEEMKI